MKAVMLSIQPKWCELIASGRKTVEVRKTAPKLETPFKCYIYCTKDMHYELAQIRFSDGWGVRHITDETTYANGCTWNMGDTLNGKVIGEFVCDYVKTFITDLGNISVHIESLKQTTLTLPELITYSGNKSRVYGWHISDLKIYDDPKELGEFCKICSKKCDTCNFYDESYGACYGDACLTRPPQSWCYVEELNE